MRLGQPNFLLRVFLTALGCLSGLALTACSDAKKLAAETQEGYEILEEIAGQVAEMTKTLRTNDWSQAKAAGAKIDRLLNTQTLSWTLQILATEERQGVEAAKALIEQFKGKAGITEDEKAALNMVGKYFEEKGRETTGDLLVLVSAFVVEQKYGHGAGGVLLRMRETYRKTSITNSLSRTNVPVQ